jgi:succinoglycan biosynthesis transport protein ExoP
LAERERPVRETGLSTDMAGSPSSSSRDGFVQILWRQRFLIAGCVALSILLAGMYLLLATPIFRSQAYLEVKPASGSLLTRDDGNPGSAGSINLFREADKMMSTEVLAHTLADPAIQELKTFEDVDNRLDYLAENLAAEVGAKNDVITVSFDSAYREDTARIVESVIASYTAFQTKKSKNTTDHVLEVLANERRSLEEAHAQKSKDMVDFKRDRGVLFNEKDSGDINLKRLEALSQALTTAQLDTINAKGAYDEAIRPIQNDPVKLKAIADLQAYHGFTPVTAAEEATLRAELFKWQTSLGDLQQQFLQNHPTIRNLQRRVDQLNIAYVAAMERRWRSSEKRESELQAKFEQQQRLAIDRSADSVEYARLQQDLKNKEEQLRAVDKQVRDLNMLEAASPGVTVNVFDPPRVPEKAALPDTKKILAIALVLGLMGGLGLACVRDWLDPRLRSTEEIKAVLGMPILGMVPRMPDNLAPAVRGQKLLLDPGSEAAEAYRALRTAIKFGVPEGRAKTILIASPASGDGKTTVASNLAIGLAQVGKRVLLIDADLRHPKQHEMFGVENHSGLSDVLAHDLTPAEVAQKTVVPNLEIVSAGATPENPADLLNSPRFMEVIEELTDRYDHIVIDSPPVLAVTDTRIIAASCDVTVMVLRADRADRKMCESARDGLLSVGANLVGLVMNCVPPGTGVYSGGSSYYGSNGTRRTSASADDHVEQDSMPLVGLDAMKSLGKRPNQMSH